MCIICHCTVPLTRDEFKECFKSNHHGAGFAWHSGGTNNYVKGFMDEEKAWEVYVNIPVPHIAHFRLASAGGVNENLTHPFRVTQDSPISLEYSGDDELLFHNGTITDWKLMLFSLCLNLGHLPSGEMSDTRVMAMAMAQMGDDALAFASASKFALLGVDGTITRYGEWQENAGNWYTNSGYKSSPRTYINYSDYGSANQYPLAYTRGRQVYYQGQWHDMSDYDKKSGQFIPYADRTCENCRLYRGNKKCKKRGKMQNTIKCADWEAKRGRGRPRKDKPADKNSKPAKEEDRLSPNGNTPPVASKSCLVCKHYEGAYHCGLPGRIGKDMVNLVACNDFEREIVDMSPYNDNYRLWGGNW